MVAKVLAADGLKQIGLRTFGFQKSRSLVAAPHDLSTMQRKPFVPFCAVVYPSGLSTITSASSETDFGAAVRARAISAFRWVKYCSAGAMLGYGVLTSWAFTSCAAAGYSATSMSDSAKFRNTVVVKVFRISHLYSSLPG